MERADDLRLADLVAAAAVGLLGVVRPEHPEDFGRIVEDLPTQVDRAAEVILEDVGRVRNVGLPEARRSRCATGHVARVVGGVGQDVVQAELRGRSPSN